MGQNHVVQTGASDAVRIPKWAFGCAIGFLVACVLAGAVLGGIWLFTPNGSTNEMADVTTGESDISERVVDAIREGTGNAGPKLSTVVPPEDFEFPPTGAGDDSVVTFVFFDPDGNEFVWKITLVHPDTTFKDGVYTMNITGQNLMGYSDDSCQVKNGRLTCSFIGRSPRFSETTVKVAVTRDKKVVTSFWGRASERRTSSGNSGQARKEDRDGDDDQAGSSEKEEFCTVKSDIGEPYGGTISLPMVSDYWEAGEPLKIEFDLSEAAGYYFPTDTSSYVLFVGEYDSVECRGRDRNNPNRLTCEIDLPQGYGHSVQELILVFAYNLDEEGNEGVIGMCEDTVAIPEMVGNVEVVEADDDHQTSGVDCSAFEYGLLWGEIEIAWPEWRAGEPLPITFKFPGRVPGLEEGNPYGYKYSVKVSDPANGGAAYYDRECEYLGYTGKLHCYVPVDSGWAGTVKAVELTVADCGPIYQNLYESLPFIEDGGGGTDEHHDDDHHDDDHYD